MPPIISFLDFVVPPVSGPLQEMTWNLTSPSAGSVTSTGLEIIASSRTSLLIVNGGPRLWNGTEADNYGATNGVFDTGVECEAWWQGYTARLRQNGRDWISVQKPGQNYIFNSVQDKYNNIGGAQTYGWGLNRAAWFTQDEGQEITFEIYTAGSLPDNWWTYEIGAGVSTGYGNFNEPITYHPDFPAQANLYDPQCKFGSNDYNSSAVGRFANATNRANQPDYYAVYITEGESNDTTFGSARTAGWYVFGPKVDGNPGGNGNDTYAPLAWPTGGSDGSTGSGGLFNNARRFQVPIAMLSAYNGATGEGGTDNWTAPFGSLLDYDNVQSDLTIAGNTVAPVGTDSTRGVSVNYASTTGLFDTYAMTSGNSIEPVAIRWASASNLSIKMTNTINTSTFSVDYPYIAFWHADDKKWRTGVAQDRGGFKFDMIYSCLPADITFNVANIPPQAVLFFDHDPGDMNWMAPYDGPVSTPMTGNFSDPQASTATYRGDTLGGATATAINEFEDVDHIKAYGAGPRGLFVNFVSLVEADSLAWRTAALNCTLTVTNVDTSTDYVYTFNTSDATRWSDGVSYLDVADIFGDTWPVYDAATFPTGTLWGDTPTYSITIK